MLTACSRALPGATDPLLPRGLAAVVRRRRKPEQPADLPPIPKRAPHQALVEQHRRARRRDAFQLHQLPQRTRAARRPCTAACCCGVELARSAPRGRCSRASARASRACTSTGSAAPGPIADRRPPRAAPARRQRRPPRRQPAAHLIDEPRLLLRQRRPLATHLPRRFVGHRRHVHLAPHAPLAATHPHQHRHQLERIEPIRLRPPRAPIHLDARRIHHAIRDPQRRQRAMNPEPVAAGFITAHHPRVAGSPNRAAPRAARARPRPDRRSPPSAATASTPNPDVIASFHSFFPNSNATYNVGSFTLTSGRVVAIITASFWLRTPQELNRAARS